MFLFLVPVQNSFNLIYTMLDVYVLPTNILYEVVHERVRYRASLFDSRSTGFLPLPTPEAAE